MAKNFGEIAFTDAVKKLQEKYGSRNSYSRMEKFNVVDGLTDSEISFIQNQNSFYLHGVKHHMLCSSYYVLFFPLSIIYKIRLVSCK